MIYLESFILPTEWQEDEMISHSMRIYNSIYPLRIFSSKNLEELTFDPITIFYGNNGSGKTTLLNIITNKLHASRKNINEFGPRFDEYVDLCSYQLTHNQYKEIKLISSDDVFDYLLDQRAVNSDVNRRKDLLVEEYRNLKYTPTEQLEDEYETMVKKVDANRMTVSKYVRTRLGNNTIIQQSNGQQALQFWSEQIQDNSLYIIDEPENSLSAENQIKLRQFIEDSARFYNCQFIIATHSPFVLSLKDAKIYDLDADNCEVKKWYQLDNMKTYYQFFKDNSDDFNKE